MAQSSNEMATFWGNKHVNIQHPWANIHPGPIREAGSVGDLGPPASPRDPTVSGGHCAVYLRLATWASGSGGVPQFFWATDRDHGD